MTTLTSDGAPDDEVRFTIENPLRGGVRVLLRGELQFKKGGRLGRWSSFGACELALGGCDGDGEGDGEVGGAALVLRVTGGGEHVVVGVREVPPRGNRRAHRFDLRVATARATAGGSSDGGSDPCWLCAAAPDARAEAEWRRSVLRAAGPSALDEGASEPEDDERAPTESEHGVEGGEGAAAGAAGGAEAAGAAAVATAAPGGAQQQRDVGGAAGNAMAAEEEGFRTKGGRGGGGGVEEFVGAISWRDSPQPGRPIEVLVSMVWKAVHQVCCRTGITHINVDFFLTWHDPRVAAAFRRDPHFELPADLWAPGFRLANGDNEAAWFVHAGQAPQWIRVLDKASGHLHEWVEFTGNVSNPMQLDDFPFDCNSLDLRMVGCRLLDGRAAGANDFVLTPAPTFFACYWASPDLTEYKLPGCTLTAYVRENIATVPWSLITCGMCLHRKPEYYFWKVIMLMWLLFTLNMSCFLFEPNMLEQRVNVTATMFLAAAATLYVVMQDLPKCDKLHRVDKEINATLVSLFGSAVWTMCVYVGYSDADGSFQEGTGDKDVMAEGNSSRGRHADRHACPLSAFLTPAPARPCS